MSTDLIVLLIGLGIPGLMFVAAAILGPRLAREMEKARAKAKAESDAAWLANVHAWNRKGPQ